MHEMLTDRDSGRPPLFRHSCHDNPHFRYTARRSRRRNANLQDTADSWADMSDQLQQTAAVERQSHNGDSVVTRMAWNSTTSLPSLRITNRSFRYASPHLWNQLPVSFRQPCIKHPADDVTLSNSPPTCSPLSPSITHSLFHSRLKTHLFHKSFPP